MAVISHGWRQVAFDHELSNEVTPVALGDRLLVVVRRHDELRAYDATCPHRGAHLGFGGCLRGSAIVCPFHGYQVRLGVDRAHRFSVPEYPLLAVGGIVFVRATPGHDNGFARYLEELDRTHFIVTGFDLSVGATEEAVIENAFDQRHFGTVHGVKASGFAVWTREDGGLEVEGTMSVPIAAAGGEVSESVASYRGRVFSPGIAAVELQGPQRYTIVTGATNTPRPGGCVVRISLAYPRSIWPAAPTPAAYEPLLKYSRRGLEQDRMIWDNLLPIATPGWMPEDEPARVFHRFCARHASG